MNKKIKYAVRMQGITMNFGNFEALSEVDLNIKEGEVHALIGENGAGKSTLMSILFGLYKQTKGNIYIDGRLENISDPTKANKLGIGMVHQHFKLVDTFTVYENIILGSEETMKVGILKNKNTKLRVKELMKKYDFHVELDKLVSNCTVAEQQRVEILKMLYKNANILIFDEPTAVLSPFQIEELLKAIKNLKNKGKTIIIISHKMDELKKVAENGTILRKGKVVKVVNINKTTKAQIGKLMVGSNVVNPINQYFKISKKDKPVLKLTNVFANKPHINTLGISDINFELYPGEILAIAGVSGNGQTEIINVITGMQKVKSGKIELYAYNKKYIIEKLYNYKIKLNKSILKEKDSTVSIDLDKVDLNKIISKVNEEDKSTINIKKLKINQSESSITFKLNKNKLNKQYINIKNQYFYLITKCLIIKKEIGSFAYKDIAKKNILYRYKNGVSHIPEDRHKHGLVLDMDQVENIILQDHRNAEFSKWSFINFSKSEKATKKIEKQFDVRSSEGIHSDLRGMSGGNQQKLIVGREVHRKNNKIIIIAQPTRGLDVGAINNIHHHILEAKKKGNAILLVSYELDEVLNLADRVLVINSGTFVEEVKGKKITRNKLGELMTTKKQEVRLKNDKMTKK